MSASFRRKPLVWGCVVFLLALPLVLHSQVPSSGAQPGVASAEARRIKPNHAADHVLVRFKPGVPPSWRGIAHAAVQAQVLRDYSSIEGLQLVKLPPGLSVEEAIGRYREQPEVLYAEPDYLIYPTAIPPNLDTNFGQLWGLNNTGQSVNGTFGLNDADIDAPEAWDITTGNSDLVIATIDTGIAWNHPDLAANMVQLESNCSDGVDNDLNGFIDDCRGINAVGGLGNSQCGGNPVLCFSGVDPMDGDNEIAPGDGIRHHGTRVAGVIGAVGNNGVGVTGVNWNVKLLGCVALSGATGPALVNLVSDAIQCLNYVIATKNVHPELTFVATNNSWATVNFSQPLMDAIDVHRLNGILFIAAADNSSNSNDTQPIFPASYYLPNVISVAATNQSDSLASFSNFGRRTVHLGAPGTNILSTVRTGTASTNDTSCNVSQEYCFGSGTSFSAPYVTGVAALLKAQNPARDWKAIKNLILAGGDNKSSLSPKTITGKRLNTNGSLTCSSQEVRQRLLPVPDMLTASPGSQIPLALLHITCADPNNNGNVVQVKNPAGQVVQTITLQDNGDNVNLRDQVAGDGIYSGIFMPTTLDTMSLVFPGNDVVTVQILEGYKCDPNPDPNTPCSINTAPFSYRAIGSNHNLNLGDEGSAQVTPPFPIPFGNLSFNTITVNANGNLSLTGTPGGFGNDSLPDVFEDTLVAPWWDDLKPISGSAQNVFWDVLGSSPTREFVVEWRDVPHFGFGSTDCPPGESVKFQVVFFESKNDIVFNYADTVFGPTCTSLVGSAIDNGASATVGVQVAFDRAKQFSFNSAQLASNKAILWQLASTAAPGLSSISPLSKTAGDPGFTLTANGSNFVSGSSVVRWKGPTDVSASDRPTTFVSSGQLTAPISAADIATPGTAQVTVFTPAPGGGTSNPLTFTISNPVPTVTTLSPTSTPVGGVGLTLFVNGSNFVSNSRVRWNGADRPTTFLGATQLRAAIPASDITTAGTVSITVFTPAPGGGTSNPQIFSITNPTPVLNNIAPTNTPAGGVGFTLTANGSNFVNGSVVQWNGSDRPTSPPTSGGTQLTATIAATDIVSAGTASVTVVNPTPGGGTSNPPLTFTITNPVPVLNNISPTAAQAGGAGFALTANGTSFVSGSVVQWNGTNRATDTSLASSGQLTATISASDIADGGSASVTVVNPGPGGGTSSPQTFTINNPVPTLAPPSSWSQSTATAGGAGFTLTVNGSNFVPSSKVRWNGAERTTMFTSGTQLTATILQGDIADGGSASVAVFNPAPQGGVSALQTFPINNPVPTLTNLSKTTATAGEAGFPLTVTGSNFVPSSKVRWNGADRTTTFVSSTQLTAAILQADIANAGTFPVAVFNPTPGGGTSGGQTFTVNNPVPVLNSMSPTSKLTTDGQFTLTVNGANFVDTGSPATSSVVHWNCADSSCNRTTTFVNSTQLMATIPQTDLASPGSASITVFNPTPGGGTSGSLTFTISTPPAVVLSTLTPPSAIVSGGSFTLTVNGSNFLPSSTVRWNGDNRVTDALLAGSGQLTATILASDIAAAGTAQVDVFTPETVPQASNTLTFSINNPAPTVSSLSPMNGIMGGPQFTLSVTGSNFVGTSVVRWNGSNRPTSFMDSQHLTATIPASDLTTAGMAQVTVLNPSPGGGVSTAQNFSINNPLPALSSISPTSKLAGEPGFPLAVTGSSFVSGAVVRWNGVDRTTTFVNGGQLTATIPATDIAVGGTAQVTVFNPAPGGGESGSQTFTVNNPVPGLSSISPTTAQAGGAGFTLTVTGSNFVNGAVAHWNGSDRIPTLVTPTQIQVTIPASDIAVGGTASVTVVNPAPGGGVSSPQTFTINNPLPAVTMLSPPSVTAGGAQFTLTVTGSNFVNGAVVRWNGSERQTTPPTSGGTQVTSTILSTDILAGSTAQITVSNPAPGGGPSNSQAFTVNNPVPIVTTVVPNSAPVGSAGLTVGVNGSGFVANSVVQWSGGDRATSLVGGQLQATIPASDLVNAGSATVRVVNPAPGGGTSASANITLLSPSITDVQPNTVPATSLTFDLIVNGANFHPGSLVRWKGSDRATMFMSPTQLKATIQMTDVATAGTAQVTVFNSAGTGGTSNAVVVTVSTRNPYPTVTGLLPAGVTQGSGAFTLTVIGSNFVSNSKVLWNGSERPTVFLNSGILQAAIPASDVAIMVPVTITVSTPVPGGGVSNGLTFPILTMNNPVPTTSALMPASVVAGSVRTSLALTVMGANFVNGSVVRWNGMDRATVFGSANQLTATIPASDVAAAGTAPVTVFTPGPGGGVSNAQTFTVNNPMPSLSSLSPGTAAAGSAGFTLVVVGGNFVPGSVVQWNGSLRLTTYVGNSQLRATIPASDLTSAGTKPVTVFNPAPGGGFSTPLNFGVTVSGSSTPSSAGTSGGSGEAAPPSGTSGGEALPSSTTSEEKLSAQSVGSESSPGVGWVIGGSAAAEETARPEVESLSPRTVEAGSAGFTLIVRGKNFLPGAVIRWNGADLATIYVASDELLTAVPLERLAAPGVFKVTVINPDPRGRESEATEFTIQ